MRGIYTESYACICMYIFILCGSSTIAADVLLCQACTMTPNHIVTDAFLYLIYMLAARYPEENFLILHGYLYMQLHRIKHLVTYLFLLNVKFYVV